MTVRGISRWTALVAFLGASFFASGLSSILEDAPKDAAAKQESVQPEAFFFALSVEDVATSATWYERVLGFETTRTIGQPGKPVRIHLLRRPGAFLELIESEQSRSLTKMEPSIKKRYLLHGVFKIGFRVENLSDTQARLKRLGVPLRGKVITESDGSMRSLQIEDPDGNVIQIFEILDEKDLDAPSRDTPSA